MNPAPANLDIILDSLLPIRDTLVDWTIRATAILSSGLLDPGLVIRGLLVRPVKFANSQLEPRYYTAGTKGGVHGV